MELVNIEKSLKQLTVVKRNGRKVEFEGDKIAIAIKKAFDSVENEKYTEKDANKVYIAVLKEIYDKYILERQTEDNQKRIKIETIQDIIYPLLLFFISISASDTSVVIIFLPHYHRFLKYNRISFC